MKNSLITFLICVCFTAFSQKNLITADVYNLSLECIPNKYLSDFEGNHYFQYLIITDKIQMGALETQGIGVIAYDKNLKELKRFELQGSEKNESILQSLFFNGNSILVTTHKIKDDQYIKMYKFDSNGKKLDEKQLLKTYKNEEIDLKVSTDSSKISVVAKVDASNKKESCRAQAVVMDNQANILWSNAENIGGMSNNHDFKSVGISNKGDVYALVQGKQKDDVYSYDLLVLSGKSSKKINLRNENFLGLVEMYETKDGFYMTGFNNDTKKDVLVSPFLVKIDEKANELKIPNTRINPTIIAELVKNKFYKEKDGWPQYFSLAHAWQNESGDHRSVWETSFLSTEKYGGITYRYHEKKHSFLFTYDASGNLKDVQVCPKELATDSDALIYPISSFVANDNLYMVYNEYENNINLTSKDKWKNKGDQFPILRKFSPDGKIKDVLLNNNIKKQIVIPNTAGLTPEGYVIFYSGEMKWFRSKNFKMGKIKLDAL